MKRPASFLLLLVVIAALAITLPAQDPPRKPQKPVRDRQVIVIPETYIPPIEMPEIVIPEIVVPEFEFDMRELERSMDAMRFEMEHLHDFVMPELPEIPDVHFDAYAIPPIPPIEIPEVFVEIPEVPVVWSRDGIGSGLHSEVVWAHEGADNLFSSLTEDEEIRIQALRALSRQSTDDRFQAIDKVLQQDPSPAVRYTAVQGLAHDLDQERVVVLLGKVARDDSHLQVRKRAIRLLGKSSHPRAVEILEALTKR